MRAAYVHATSSQVDGVGGTNSFDWDVGDVDLCMLSWPPGPAHFLACARVEGGELQVTATSVSASAAAKGWFATGPLLRFEWTLVARWTGGVEGAGDAALFLDVDFAALARVTDDRFPIAQGAFSLAIPTVGLESAGGLGVHFL